MIMWFSKDRPSWLAGHSWGPAGLRHCGAGEAGCLFHLWGGSDHRRAVVKSIHLCWSQLLCWSSGLLLSVLKVIHSGSGHREQLLVVVNGGLAPVCLVC